MDSYWVYACSQHPSESTYEYFERYKCYLDEYPEHGFQLHELITDFLDGMLPEECYTLRILAGRSLMDCTPGELWSLIEERADSTRPYTECNPDLVDMVYQLSKQVAAIGEVNYGRLQSTPETTQFSVDDEEVVVSIEERAEEDIMDEEFGADEPTQFPLFDEEETYPVYDEEASLPLFDKPLFAEERVEEEFDEPFFDEPLYDEPLYDEEVSFFDEERVDDELEVVPTMCKEDVPMEEWISPPCSDIILEQNLVTTYNPIILPISKMFLSFNVQNDKIEEAPRNNQVWGSLEKTEIHDPMVRIHMITQASDRIFDELCINWKTRKKSMGKVQNSVKRSNNHSGDFRPALSLMKLRPNWKKRKKGKCFITNSEFSIVSVNVQKNRASFGWKPGWKLWKNASHNVARKVRKDVRKYDGIHPWAPNI